jgi:histidinol dehydrogenase
MTLSLNKLLIKPKEWQRPRLDQQSVKQTVQQMLAHIQAKGDSAITHYSQQFDGFAPELIELKPFADYPLETELAKQITISAQRIRRFAEFQQQNLTDSQFSDEYGSYGQRFLPIEAMAAYIPAGRFPLISSALMTLIPAQVAGCSQRIAVSPATHPAVLAAASLAGATAFVKLGGAQAIAALAYGSQWQAGVDMIVGPGNAYVNQAKALLQQQVRIDTLAGPSELAILCDQQAPADWLVWDALAQAEHDPQALSVIISWQRQALEGIYQQLLKQSQCQQLIEQQQIVFIHCESPQQATEFSNELAPEHLMLCSPAITPTELKHYGSLFIGANSAVALGDYCTGPNHTLPTLGYARKKGGLSVADFLRIMTWQQINDHGRQQLGQTGVALAEAEGLSAHSQSLRIRRS